MGDSISAALTLIDDRLEELHASMTDEPIEVVTERYLAWKRATHAALEGVVVESALERFEMLRGAADHGGGHRPTPPVFLDGAASRSFLMAMKRDLETDPAAVLRLPPSEPTPPQRMGLLKLVDLLERRLPGAFRGRPEVERDLHNGLETLLAGSGIAYEREGESIAHLSRGCAPDFTFPDLRTALELKLCEGSGREKEIVAEIGDEIPAYRARYPQIVFAIYDLGFIRDPGQFAAAFQAHGGVLVLVLKP